MVILRSILSISLLSCARHLVLWHGGRLDGEEEGGDALGLLYMITRRRGDCEDTLLHMIHMERRGDCEDTAREQALPTGGSAGSRCAPAPARVESGRRRSQRAITEISGGNLGGVVSRILSRTVLRRCMSPSADVGFVACSTLCTCAARKTRGQHSIPQPGRVQPRRAR